MLLLILGLVLCTDRIKLKLIDDDKFLGEVGGKLQKVEYKNALSIKLNTLPNISEKTIEGKEGKALTEKGWWFFPKSFSFQPNDNGSNQSFKIVYYSPNEYILMKGDYCLGFRPDGKFKRRECTLEETTRFKICTNRLCDSYLDLKKDLACIKGILNMGNQNRNRNDNNYGDNRYDPDSDGDDFYTNRLHNNSGRRNNNNNSDSNSSDDMNDVFSGCKEYKYGIPGFNNGRYPNHRPRSNRHNRYPGYGGDRPLYDKSDRGGFPYNC